MQVISLLALVLLAWDTCGAPSYTSRVPGITSFTQCLKYKKWENYITPELIKEKTEKILGTYKESPRNTSFVISGGFAGWPVKKNEFPFMAALGYGNENDRKYLCGGSLISEQFVLTAAHCIFSPQRVVVTVVRLGDLNIKDKADDEHVQEFKVSKYIVHPDYKYPIKYNDIALLKLNQLAVFTDSVKPICLDYWIREDYHSSVILMFAAGWGNIGYGGDPSDQLLKFNLRIFDLVSCHKTYKKDFSIPQGILAESQICAGGRDELTDTCEGDSGGPLIYSKIYVNNSLYTMTLAGIVSFGVPCALELVPAVYTKVVHYIKWIEDEVWPDHNSIKDPNRIVFPDD